MLYWLLYFFVAFGSKLLLALVTIYLLLPSVSSCNGCDEETLLLQMGRGRRFVSLIFLGRVQRRWCPRCGWEGYARVRRPRCRTMSDIRGARPSQLMAGLQRVSLKAGPWAARSMRRIQHSTFRQYRVTGGKAIRSEERRGGEAMALLRK
jgi:hypothetical protein